MGLVIPDNFAQVTYFFSGPDCPTGAAITLGLDVTTSTGPQTECDELAAAWADNVLQLQSSGTHFVLTRLKFGPNATGPIYETASTSTGGAGAAGNASTAVLVTKTTATGGRSGRGRIYIPGISEADVNAGGIMTGSHATWVTEVANWVQAVENVYATAPVLLHSESTGLEPTPITGMTVQTTIANQRRRQRR